MRIRAVQTLKKKKKAISYIILKTLMMKIKCEILSNFGVFSNVAQTQVYVKITMEKFWNIFQTVSTLVQVIFVYY